MIKVALKHLIFEVCIEQMLNSIGRNFFMINKTRNIKTGDKLNWLRVHAPKSPLYHIMYNIEITDVSNTFLKISYRGVRIIYREDDFSNYHPEINHSEVNVERYDIVDFEKL